jgi:hypothetical protein
MPVLGVGGGGFGVRTDFSALHEVQTFNSYYRTTRSGYAEVSPSVVDLDLVGSATFFRIRT